MHFVHYVFFACVQRFPKTIRIYTYVHIHIFPIKEETTYNVHWCNEKFTLKIHETNFSYKLFGILCTHVYFMILLVHSTWYPSLKVCTRVWAIRSALHTVCMPDRGIQAGPASAGYPCGPKLTYKQAETELHRSGVPAH